ncbi:MAG: hypothetical protein JWM40_2223 [Frankiales bacterium]|nr:hypothetical protein [Frankiales bacterium]
MKRLLAVMYRLGAHRTWWLMFLLAAIVFAVIRATVGGVLSLVVSLPIVIFAYLLLSQRARWKRDEERERTTGIRRGPFD